MKKPKIKQAVILLNYNGWQDTLVCLSTIYQAENPPHVIVVDNASTDQSLNELARAYPDLDLIVSQKNLGFSAGNNLGIRKAMRMGAQVIHLLNNDTTVDPKLFCRAYQYVAHRTRIATGKIYYAKGFEYHEAQKGEGNVLWYAGGDIDWGTMFGKHQGIDEVDHNQYDVSRQVAFASGCYMAISRSVIQKIGLLDERYFLYLEDAEYCLRASSFNIPIHYNPKLVLYHRNSRTNVVGSPLVDYYLTRNRFLLGFSYGSLRLRFALFREGIWRNWTSPIRRQAFLDFMFKRLGNQNDTIVKTTKKN